MRNVIEELKTYLNNKKVLITCSCGVDSMTLLSLALENISKENIVVAHVNHQRREEAVLEEEYIRMFCKKNNLTLEVLKLSKDYVGNFQEWARNQRYEFFESVVKKHKLDDLLEFIVNNGGRVISAVSCAGVSRNEIVDVING